MDDGYTDPDANLPYPESPEYQSASVRDLDAPPDDRVLDPLPSDVVVLGGARAPEDATVTDPNPQAQPNVLTSEAGQIADERNLIASVGGQFAKGALWRVAGGNRCGGDRRDCHHRLPRDAPLTHRPADSHRQISHPFATA